MTVEELQILFSESNDTVEGLRRRKEHYGSLTRKECDDLRHAVQRIGIVGKELWVLSGSPSGPEFDCFRGPIPLSPLPAWPLDLTGGSNAAIH